MTIRLSILVVYLVYMMISGEYTYMSVLGITKSSGYLRVWGVLAHSMHFKVFLMSGR